MLLRVPNPLRADHPFKDSVIHKREAFRPVTPSCLIVGLKTPYCFKSGIRLIGLIDYNL